MKPAEEAIRAAAPHLADHSIIRTHRYRPNGDRVFGWWAIDPHGAAQWLGEDVDEVIGNLHFQAALDAKARETEAMFDETADLLRRAGIVGTKPKTIN